MTTDPIARTVYGLTDREHMQTSVPWCETHNEPIWMESRSGQGFCHGAYHHDNNEDCKSLDPHAPTAVWRDTDDVDG